jgi:hypothetical protein
LWNFIFSGLVFAAKFINFLLIKTIELSDLLLSLLCNIILLGFILIESSDVKLGAVPKLLFGSLSASNVPVPAESGVFIYNFIYSITLLLLGRFFNKSCVVSNIFSSSKVIISNYY